MSDLAETGQAQRPGEKRAAGIRRFTLADSLILIAAIGIGLGMAKIGQSGYLGAVPGVSPPFIAQVYSSLCWSGLTLVIALLPLRLLPPRPPMRRVRRQPGFIASVTSAFYLADLVVSFSFMRLARPSPWGVFGYLYWIATPTVGSVILLGWFVLAVSGRWQAERSWIDRFGRALGIGWIIAYAIHVCAGGLW